MSEPREGEWVVVRRFVNTTSADMAADFLKDSGVPVIVQGQHAAEVLPASVIEIDLLVPLERAEEAREAFEAFEHGTPVDPPPPGS